MCPVLLRDLDTPDDVVIAGATFSVYPASADAALFAVGAASAEKELPPTALRTLTKLVAEHVVAWRNVGCEEWHDAKGAKCAPDAKGARKVVVDAVYPASGKKPRPFDGKVTEEHVTESEILARVHSLRRFPWNVLSDLENRVLRVYREAVASGKG